jgi:RND family efflux transporter MFP subunit
MKKTIKAAIAILLMLLLCLIVYIGAKRLSNDEASKKIQLKDKKPSPVRVVKAYKGKIQQWVIGEGTAQAVRREFLNFERSGKVVFINKDKDGKPLREGSKVRGPLPGERFGELLARIDKREQIESLRMNEATLAQARQNVKALNADVDQCNNEYNFARANYERSQQLYGKGLKSKAAFDADKVNYLNSQTAKKNVNAQLKAAKSQVKSAIAQLNRAKLDLEKTSIFAPFDGVITYINIKIGDFAGPEYIDQSSESSLIKTSPIVIVDDSQYEIPIHLPSFDCKLVERGQFALITWGSTMPSDFEKKDTGSKNFASGIVYSVSPSISPGGRSILVKIRTETEVKQIWDGQYVTCWIAVKEKADAVLAPSNSLMYRNNQAYVFTIDPQTNTAKKCKVITGIEDVKQVEITEGIHQGDLIVTDGRHRLVNGTVVTILDN